MARDMIRDSSMSTSFILELGIIVALCYTSVCTCFDLRSHYT